MNMLEDTAAAALQSETADEIPIELTKVVSQKPAAPALHLVTKRDAAPSAQYAYVDKPVYEVVKRIFDVVFASIALIVLSPLMLIIAIAIVVDDPSAGPIYTQMRAGRYGKEFKFHKFRSMVANADALKASLMDRNEMDGPVFKITDDPRITKVGRFIRKSSLDELPQLIDIIRGDMSIVGPRPLPVKESDACTPYQRLRLNVMPGLSCYWQCSGRSNLGFQDMIRLDFLYICERSLWTDIKVIFRTIGAVLRMTGAK